MHLYPNTRAREPELAAYAVVAAHAFDDGPAPAFLTGTSTEYLGRRPLPRAVREGFAILVLGPHGVGKSQVSERIAGESALTLDPTRLQEAIIDRVRQGRWAEHLLAAPSLVLDGPAWLGQRRGVLRVLTELLSARLEARRRTVVIQCDTDGSALELVPRLPHGAVVVVGLRFPTGARGRLRFARRLCDELGVPRSRARGTERLEPWGYPAVAAALRTPVPMRRRRAPEAVPEPG
jgi:hypothetical protein